MRPLRDDPDRSDPVAACAARLLSEVRSVELTEARAARMRQALDRPRRKLELKLLRPAAVVAALVSLAATAGATYAAVRMLGDRPPSIEPRLEEAPALDVGPRPGESEGAVEAPEPAPRDADAPVTPEADPPGRAAPPAPDRAAGSSQHGAAAPADSATTPAPGATLVVDAMRALRHEKNPDKAARLLEEYQKQHPSGALAEEALALQMESAAARGDPSASHLAATYLSRFPQGRFRAAAEQVLSRARSR